MFSHNVGWPGEDVDPDHGNHTLKKHQYKPIKMLGRKQSLRGELLPYEVAQEETNNESVGVDWMNKVTHTNIHKSTFSENKSPFTCFLPT